MNSDFFGNFDEEPQIDLTPLIDCLFMLIIFFVLTMSFSKPVLEVMLPQAAHGEVSRERNDLLLSVKKDGSLWLGSESTTLEGLSAALDAAPERTLNIYMDREAPFAKFVEVMDLRTARHITQISIPNCRYIVFKGRYAYVSSYAGLVQIDPNARLGYVAKIDTATMQIVGTCTVGYQPEEMVIVGKKLYVANSGGYRVPDYDRTVSVIDLDTFGEVKKIDVAINLHRMELDAYGQIWVSSRGDYYDTPSRTYVIDSRTDEVTDEFKLLPNSEMTVCGDSLYVYSTEWSYPTQSNTVSYAIVNVRTKKIVTRNFITDGTDRRIAIPYGIAVNPATREIFVTDAGNYVTPGKLYCFNPDGTKKWEVETGDIPAHIAFTYTELAPLR